MWLTPTIKTYICCTFLFALIGSDITGQQTSESALLKSSTCARENALSLIEQQIDFTKTFDNDERRVAVLIRAADLLWPHKEKTARAAYTDAFEVAQRHFKEKSDAPTRDGQLLIGTLDQRYVVISSIAKHDAAWAKKLTAALLKAQEDEAKDASGKNPNRDITTAERLLSTAATLLNSDQPTALTFGRNSLQYPATFYLSLFLYQLSSANRLAADQFYREALAAYSNAPMERLLYLSSYPFGNDREAGDMPAYTIYQVPAGFLPSPALQRLFVQAILHRAQIVISNPAASSSEVRVSDTGEIWLALTRLQNQIQRSLPDLAPAAEDARGSIAAQFSDATQRDLQSMIERDNPPKRSFDGRVELALKNPSVDARDQQLTAAVLNSSKDEKLDRVLTVIDKISDSNIRQALLNWFYFERAQRAIKDQDFDEARKLAAKVEELDQRAFLYSRIAEESLKRDIDQTQARELLEDVYNAAAKSESTLVKARTLLTVAYLYTKIEMNRAIGIIGEAVSCINKIEQPDFSRQFVIRKIEGKTFSSYASISTPGFTPESAFSEIAKIDLDGALNQASNFTDKSLRAMTTVAAIEHCLKETPESKGKTPTFRAKYCEVPAR